VGGPDEEPPDAGVVVNGNVVSPGMPLVTSAFVADYDEALLDSGNHPPHFVGGKRVLTIAGGTWSMELGQGTR